MRFMPRDMFIRWIIVSTFMVLFVLYASIDGGVPLIGILFITVLILFACFLAGTVAVIFSNIGDPDVDIDETQFDGSCYFEE